MKVNNIDITKTVQNFGKLKNMFNNMLVEGMVTKDNKSKDLFKSYVKSIKENEILRTQFLIYNNIENKIETNDFKATQFVQESISLMNKFSKDEIIKANSKLAESLLWEQEVDNHLEELHENITTLIFTEKTPNTIDTIIEATAKVVDYIKNNKPKEVNESIELPVSMISTIMVDKYNEKYASLDESEKAVLKALIESDDNQKKEVYGNIVKECVDLINTSLENYSGEDLSENELKTKDKLLRVKEKLLNDKQEINENFYTNITRLVELRGSLKK